MNWFQHYIVTDLYDPIWPNIAASLICAVWVVGRVKVHIKNHRKWMNQHFQAIHAKQNIIHSAIAAQDRYQEIKVKPNDGGDNFRTGVNGTGKLLGDSSGTADDSSSRGAR